MERLELARSAGIAGRQLLDRSGARGLVIGVSVALFGAILSLRIADPNVADTPLTLFVVPISLCAISFGVRGGLISALIAVAIATGWHLRAGHQLSPIGYLTRTAAFVLVGGLVGKFAEERRALVRALSRHQQVSIDAIATANFDGFFTSLNPAWTRILGYSQEELLSRPYLDFVHPEDVAETIEEGNKLSENGTDSINFRNRYRAKDGSYRWLEWVAASVPEDRLIYAAARDITEKKEAEEALGRYQQLLEHAVRDRTSQLEEAREEVLRRLARAAEYRDDDTYEHAERVGRTAGLVAEQLGLPKEQVALIRQAAPLHDVGKLGISDAILLKPGKLTKAEFEVMKTHARTGARIVSGSQSDVLRLAEEIMLTHHEWWNGNGYPAQLTGEQIPLSGRIVAIADVFDALTHDRPYKEAWPLETAVDEIKGLSGRQFDPQVVEAFERLSHAELLAPVTPLLRSRGPDGGRSPGRSLRSITATNRRASIRRGAA